MSKKRRYVAQKDAAQSLTGGKNAHPKTVFALSPAQVLPKNLRLNSSKFERLIIICLVLFLSVGIISATGLGEKIAGSFASLFAGLKANNHPSAASPVATGSPQLAKEYIYAGSRMLAIEDANAAFQHGSDLAVWRLSSGTWYVKDFVTGNYVAYQFGANGDIPAPGDFDADGKTDFAVFRPGDATWYVMPSAGGQMIVAPFGLGSDKPAVADYDGDGKSDIAVFRESNTTWYIRRSSDSQLQITQFGAAGDSIVPADYDGDGKSDIAQFRSSNSTWYILQSTNNQIRSEQFGQSGDKPLLGDFDGDGRFDLATWRGTDNNWRIKNSASNQTQTINWGAQSTDLAVTGDYDGDGKTDIAVWRASGAEVGWWFIRKSSDGQNRYEQWGTTGDIPVPAAYRR